MDFARFRECSEAFGAEKHRWPPAEHTLYDRFARTPEGLSILAEAGRTDSFLDALPPAQPDAYRARHIAILTKPAWQRLGAPAAALAASALLGFVVGYMQTVGAADAGAAAQLLLGPHSLEEIGL